MYILIYTVQRTALTHPLRRLLGKDAAQFHEILKAHHTEYGVDNIGVFVGAGANGVKESRGLDNVYAKFRTEHPEILAQWCYNHILQLAAKASRKGSLELQTQIKEVDSFINSTAASMALSVDMQYKLCFYDSMVKEDGECSFYRDLTLHKIKWIAHAKAYCTINERWAAFLLQATDKSQKDKNGGTWRKHKEFLLSTTNYLWIAAQADILMAMERCSKKMQQYGKHRTGCSGGIDELINFLNDYTMAYVEDGGTVTTLCKKLPPRQGYPRSLTCHGLSKTNYQ